ncbi:MAG TPA: class I adenylate-forming enzyme family protein [Myxococcota bacterium]|nr:class I adenylate-forming enzyme family protein [Myxococcota bacterium]
MEPLSGRSWAPEEVLQRIGRRVGALTRLGVQAGDRAFLHYGNSLEFFVDLLAIWHLGACAVPVDPRLTRFEVKTLTRSARPRISIFAESPEAGLERELAELGARVAPLPGGGSETDDALPPSRLRLDDDALILFTSGTTGNPKGVVHTHRSLRARWTSLSSALGLASFRRTLCLLPTHFGHGLICNCLFPWLHGQDLYVLPPFRADLLVQLGELIDRHAITFLSSVPTVWRLALKTSRPPSGRSLVRVHCGSAPLSASLWRSVQDWSGTRDVKNAYGITETGSWLAGTPDDFEGPEDGLIGRAWGGELRVMPGADPERSPAWSTACAPGESGHVWIHTPALMKGYLDRDDLTRAVVVDGWFSTGDIGLVDDRGNLFLRGREREEINKAGMKVYPGDIDAVVERFPQTLDVCTFAYADPLLGEDVGVAVVLPGATDQTLLALHTWASEHLAVHQLPRRWYLVDEIPRTSRGKVNRANVAAHCEQVKPVNFAKLQRR